MSDATLAQYEPINVLKRVHDDVWIVDGPVVRMAALGFSFPFPTRMTVVRLCNGDLWCHSPTALTAALKAELDRLGPVRHLVSPNKLHYAFISSWSQAYPHAIAWASPGVRERAARQKMAAKFDSDLTDEAPPDWANDIDQLIFRGSRLLEEVVFFHRKSRTLLLADLIENFELKKVPWQFRWLIRLGGCFDPDGKAPLDLRMTFHRHKAEARRYLERMLAWNAQTIIFSHGGWYRDNGSAELQRAFRWLD